MADLIPVCCKDFNHKTGHRQTDSLKKKFWVARNLLLKSKKKRETYAPRSKDIVRKYIFFFKRKLQLELKKPSDRLMSKYNCRETCVEQ